MRVLNTPGNKIYYSRGTAYALNTQCLWLSFTQRYWHTIRDIPSHTSSCWGKYLRSCISILHWLRIPFHNGIRLLVQRIHIKVFHNIPVTPKTIVTPCSKQAGIELAVIDLQALLTQKFMIDTHTGIELVSLIAIGILEISVHTQPKAACQPAKNCPALQSCHWTYWIHRHGPNNRKAGSEAR